MDRFFRIRSHREGSTGVLVATGDIEWLSGGLDAGVFGTPRIDPAFGDPNDLDEFDRIDRRAQVRKFPLEVKLNGATEQAIIDTQGELLAEVADCNEWGGTIRYRPEGLDYPVNLDLLDIAVGDGKGVWAHSAEGFRYLKMTLEVSVQPWAFTDPMKIDDLFETNTLSSTGGIYNDGGADWTASIDNDLLTPQQQGIENTLAATDWLNDTNATVTRSTAQFYAGAASLSLAAASAATMSAKTPSGTSGFGVKAGASLTVTMRSRAATAGRVIGGGLRFYDSAGSLLGGTLAFTPASNTTSGWTQYSVSGTVPANAVYASLQVSVSSPLNTEVHYFDDMHIVQSGGVPLADTWAQSTERLHAGEVWSTETRLVHTGSRWQYADPIARICFHPGDAQAIGSKFGVILKWLDASNYLEAYCELVAANDYRLKIAKVVAGVRTNLFTGTTLGALTGRLKLDAAVGGNRVFANVSASNQYEGLTAPTVLFHRVALGASSTQFGAGVRGRVGMVLTPQRTDANVSWFLASEGFVNGDRSTPQNFRLSAPIPTAASPLFELHSGNAGSLKQRAFFALGWWDRPRPLNHVNRQAQESNGLNWDNTLLAGILAATGTALASGSVPPSSSPISGSIRMACAAVADAGARWRDYGRMYCAGKTYVLEAKAKLISGSVTLRAKLGVTGDIATGDTVLTSSWQTVGCEWTPSGDAVSPYAAFASNAVATATWDVCDLRIYEKEPSGLTPTLFSGGYLPVGVIPAVATRLNGGGGGGMTGVGIHGDIWKRNGAGTCGVTLPITTHPMEDPAEEILVDYFVTTWQDSTISGVTFSTYQLDIDDAESNLKQYAEPFGTTGKPVGVIPSAGSDVRRMYYLGRLAWSKSEEQRNLVVIATVTGTGNFALDSIVGFPASGCVMTPTGVDDANLASELQGVVVQPDLRIETLSGQNRPARLQGAPLRMVQGARPECVILTADNILPDCTTSSADSNATGESNRFIALVPRPRVYLNEAVST